MHRAFSRLRSLEHALNDLFIKTYGPSPFGVGFDPEEWERWMPSADVYRRGGRWVIRVELPEVSSDQLSISVRDHHLLIEGERKPPEGFEAEEALFQECSYGPFERVITLPDSIPEDQVQARFHQGMLYITLPAAPPRERRIDVESEPPPTEASKAA